MYTECNSKDLLRLMFAAEETVVASDVIRAMRRILQVWDPILMAGVEVPLGSELLLEKQVNDVIKSRSNDLLQTIDAA